MQNFRYTALDAQGVSQQGTLQAESAKHVRQQLRERGLSPISVETAKKTFSFSLFSFTKQTTKNASASLKLSELAFFTRQLALLLQAGFPIEQALESVQEQFNKASLRQIIREIRNRIIEGLTLAQAIADFPKAFPAIYSVSIEAGEQAGKLALVLTRLADYAEQQEQTRQKIQQALIYPCITMLFAIGITAFLLTYLLPTITDVFTDNAQSLPFITKFLLGLSQGVRSYGLFVLLFLLLIIGLLRQLLKRPHYRYRWHALLLRLPLLGYLLKSTNMTRYTRTFGLLCASGLPALEAMTLATKLVTQLPIHQSLQTASHRIREGSPIHTALRQSQYFDTLSLNLITNGEQTGKLAEMLEQAAQQQENQLTRFIQFGLSLLEPLMMVIMGGLVLFIVLAILLPIFSMNQLMS